MGKSKQKPQRHGRRAHYAVEADGEDSLPSSAFELSISEPPSLWHLQEDDKEGVGGGGGGGEDDDEEEAASDCHYRHNCDCPSKYELYQISVQSPKGDISYLQKFFLTYIGGRSPVHLREDFCGTALICAEWLKGGFQRLATGLDLDLEALTWGLQNNFKKLGGNACGRVRLLSGNVLQPLASAQLVNTPDNSGHQDTMCVASGHSNGGYEVTTAECKYEKDGVVNVTVEELAEDNRVAQNDSISGKEMVGVSASTKNAWPSVDIICAFNYSCCCLHKRSDFIMYLKHALDALSAMGGIFAMDLYGGRSSESPLKLRRHFPNFTYVWEQEAFDVIKRMTKISLHFQLKNSKMLRHAFTYRWRLWSLPEVTDCLEEAGFDSIHVWLRDMPTLEEREDNDDSWDNDSKYEETTSFYQQSAWNAYVVAVAFPKRKC